MTTSHEPHTADPQTCYVFAKLSDFTVSVCAPSDWPKDRVEAFANETFPNDYDPFVSVDIARLMGTSRSTPGVCNQAPRQRMHWLLFRRSLAHQDYAPDFNSKRRGFQR
jgi:hypothetical protein